MGGIDGADASIDRDNGHGNNSGGVDPSKPGKGGEGKGSDKPDCDNGHGNDAGWFRAVPAKAAARVVRQV